MRALSKDKVALSAAAASLVATAYIHFANGMPAGGMLGPALITIALDSLATCAGSPLYPYLGQHTAVTAM